MPKSVLGTDDRLDTVAQDRAMDIIDDDETTGRDDDGPIDRGVDLDAERSNAGQVVEAAAEIYERFFVPALFGAWPPILLDRADVGAGQRVLDVGCGTGIVARAAVERVEPGGSVVGLDANPGMLRVASEAAPNVEWRQGLAEELPFESASFDRVLSQFALMFFENREAALSEMARVAVPGSPVTVATWAALEQTPGYAAMAVLLERLFGPDAADAIRTPYVLGDPTEVAELLSSALDGVEVVTVEGTARFDSIDDWVHTDIRGWTLAEAIDDTQYGVLLEEARRELAPFTDGDGRVRFAAPAIVATGIARQR